MTAAGSACGTCGTELREYAKFCDECGAPTTAAKPAEYKQVTVLFADVVHSMDIAAALGAERLREIMAELVDGCAIVVRRYGGTVDKFTGDGIMALFGAPVALEDHAFRACLAALDVQREAQRLSAEVERRDGIALQLRVGVNSGQVIAGEIGSGPLGYTAIGEQVGMAQRMESVAPPGGVMLGESRPAWCRVPWCSRSPNWCTSRALTPRCPPGDCWPSVNMSPVGAPSHPWSAARGKSAP
jgi:adenylate cyclase